MKKVDRHEFQKEINALKTRLEDRLEIIQMALRYSGIYIEKYDYREGFPGCEIICSKGDWIALKEK